MKFYNILIVGAGGFIGSIARYLTVQAVDKRMNVLYPYGTLAVNVLGSFLLGLIIALTLKKTGSSDQWKLFLGTGFCGGFTTFSAFALENFSLAEQKLFNISILYILTSLVLGILAIWAGMILGKLLAP